MYLRRFLGRGPRKWGSVLWIFVKVPGTHIPGTEATARQTTKEPSVVAYFISVIIVMAGSDVPLDLPAIACYSDTI